MGRVKLYDRETLLKKSLYLFWTLGYAGTSIKLLENETGVNKSALYAEFSSKGKLFDETLKYYLDDCRDLIQKLLARHPMGMWNVRQFLIKTPEMVRYRGCFMTVLKRERNLLPSSSVTKINKHYRTIRTLLEDNIKADGHSEDEAEKISELLASFIQGTYLRIFYGESLIDLEDQVDLLLCGLTKCKH